MDKKTEEKGTISNLTLSDVYNHYLALPHFYNNQADLASTLHTKAYCYSVQSHSCLMQLVVVAQCFLTKCFTAEGCPYCIRPCENEIGLSDGVGPIIQGYVVARIMITGLSSPQCCDIVTCHFQPPTKSKIPENILT